MTRLRSKLQMINDSLILRNVNFCDVLVSPFSEDYTAPQSPRIVRDISWSSWPGCRRWRRRRRDPRARWTGRCCFPWTPACRPAAAMSSGRNPTTSHLESDSLCTCTLMLIWELLIILPRRMSFLLNPKCGRTRGRREKYQRKYWAVTTLLNVTNTRVWQNIAKLMSWILLNLTAITRRRITCGRKVMRLRPRSSYSTVR